MTNLLKVENQSYITDSDTVESLFIRTFDLIPENVMYFPDLKAEKYENLKDFLDSVFNFVIENSEAMTKFVNNRAYEEKFCNSVVLYGEEFIVTITARPSTSIKLGVDRKDIKKLLGPKASINIAFSDNSPFAKQVYEKHFSEFIEINPEGSSKAHFSIIEDDRSGNMYLSDVSITPQEDIDLNLMYNDDFVEVHDNILHSLNTHESGLVLLHGEMGCGKTSYIRRLIQELSEDDRDLIYMPPNMANMLSTPSFLRFLSDHKNSIIIIEDAENVLKTREAGANSSVANILNSTDGLMGDALKLHFICTFNAQKEDIDSALFRKGRLLQEYKFSKLDVEKARALWKKIGNPMDEFPNTDLSLADIFNHGTRIEIDDNKGKNSFGFTRE